MWRDDAYLLDILLAGRKVFEYTRGLSHDEFKRNELVQDAAIRLISVIGEAASKVSFDFRAAHPDIPWSGMIGMRHRLVHDYFRVDVEKVWDTIQHDIPRLIALIEPLVPPPKAK